MKKKECYHEAKHEVSIVINCCLFRHNIVPLWLVAMSLPCLVISAIAE